VAWYDDQAGNRRNHPFFFRLEAAGSLEVESLELNVEPGQIELAR
jgi:hypothetical protein